MISYFGRLMVVLLTILAADKAHSAETATITSWQYCHGCKETVLYYLQKIYHNLQGMERAGKPSMSFVDANKLVELICDEAYFDHFQPFVKLSCIKILNEGKEQFLKHFAGGSSVQTVLNKAETFRRTVSICGEDFGACKAEDFTKANRTIRERTKCNACRIVGSEAEIHKKAIAKGTAVKEYFEDEFCGKLGYSHQPYNWIESVCEEMVEDKIDDILDIIRFNERVAATGMAPSESATDMMCREFYNCKSVARTEL